jgi:hypothetical protein
MLREQRSNQPPLLVSQLFILHLKSLIQRLKVEFRLSSRFLGLVQVLLAWMQTSLRIAY